MDLEDLVGTSTLVAAGRRKAGRTDVGRTSRRVRFLEEFSGRPTWHFCVHLFGQHLVSGPRHLQGGLEDAVV